METSKSAQISSPHVYWFMRGWYLCLWLKFTIFINELNNVDYIHKAQK